MMRIRTRPPPAAPAMIGIGKPESEFDGGGALGEGVATAASELRPRSFSAALLMLTMACAQDGGRTSKVTSAPLTCTLAMVHDGNLSWSAAVKAVTLKEDVLVIVPTTGCAAGGAGVVVVVVVVAAVVVVATVDVVETLLIVVVDGINDEDRVVEGEGTAVFIVAVVEDKGGGRIVVELDEEGPTLLVQLRRRSSKCMQLCVAVSDGGE